MVGEMERGEIEKAGERKRGVRNGGGMERGEMEKAGGREREGKGMVGSRGGGGRERERESRCGRNKNKILGCAESACHTH